MPSNLIERVLKTVRQYDMLKEGDSILAAVSGGPDSVFLLHAIARLKDKLKLKRIAACHLDHGLRGKESGDDAVFVRRLADGLGIDCFHKRVSLKELKDKARSTEEVGREERYKFYKEAAEQARANVIATGHTLDDQAETVLMRLIKGASLKGVVGISPSRPEGRFRVVRPLAWTEKGAIKAYLEEHAMAYRTDSTNFQPVYFRNVVRAEIIPFLEKYNPRLKRVLCNFAEHLREDFEFIDKERTRLQPQIVRGGAGNVCIDLKDLVLQPRALQKEILRGALEKAGGEIKKLSFKHWKDMEHFIKHNRKGNSLHLPGGIRVSRTSTALEFKSL
ncbi:MAG: tRNA lysidine(34) synthetase TilS [Candidatus Omnitrophica bacterium]|nr:tRNA lysidine(34) synthetase TilS [Candidatus Omnitrophota bacterium]